ncbi:aminotransferase class I/II-fold pyridoxal phosphate-dependent enzyme [Temperatibacter marinus]|uniref:8-amino-7-oxononanoate synthase n=1 Tax=Temperatibacter marinus TaxID=1456591 RepID=A0AA52EKS1_9PROT|nr:aminotransferase class I/II-fold pyridoxal phosphate-dependent enzyme [Temperatibacter marinus]WND03821.1 aminotransferase class I/II-fold pyridoxal phosphate-dependent enzyme [Temperatibacter marinus]
MKSLETYTKAKLDAIDAKAQRRFLFDHSRSADMSATRESWGQIVSFTDNDYLGLSTDPAVIDAAQKAMAQYGAGAGASRLVTGNHPLHRDLEKKIAQMKGTEDAVVFGSGYMANTGVIPTFLGKQDVIFADELIHTSLHAGIKLSGATVYFFNHNDCDHLKELLRQYRHQYPHAMIVVDGVYSMDGDMAPLKKQGQIAKVFDCWLYSDDAHGFGVVGGGKGSTVAQEAEGLIPFQMGTLSKAIGSYGGYLAASHAVCELLRSRSRSLIYTTALPPAVIAASIRSLEIIETDKERIQRPVILAQRFADALNLPNPTTPIVPLIMGSEEDTLAASKSLADQGYLAWAFRPPTVAPGTSRLRFCFSATHSDAQVDGLIQACLSIGLLA